MENTKSKTKFLKRLSVEERQELLELLNFHVYNNHSKIETIIEFNYDCMFVNTNEYTVNPYGSTIIPIELLVMDDYKFIERSYSKKTPQPLKEQKKILYSYMSNKFGEEYIADAKLEIMKKYKKEENKLIANIAALKTEMNEELSLLSPSREKKGGKDN